VLCRGCRLDTFTFFIGAKVLKVQGDCVLECVSFIPPVRASYDARKCEGKLTASTVVISPSLTSDELVLKFPDAYLLDAKSWGAQSNEDDTTEAHSIRKLEVECMILSSLSQIHRNRNTDDIAEKLSLGTRAARQAILKFCLAARRGYKAKNTQLKVS